MPLCLFFTNLKRSDLPEDLEERMAKTVSDVLNQPVEWVFCMSHCDMPAFLAGSRDPGMVCQIHAKVIFNNEALAKESFPKLFPVLKEATKIPGDRIIIEFIPVEDPYAAIGS
ncbi:hypothetical protein ACF0H5_017555 [Mactra antiquata]